MKNQTNLDLVHDIERALSITKNAYYRDNFTLNYPRRLLNDVLQQADEMEKYYVITINSTPNGCVSLFDITIKPMDFYIGGK